IGKNILREGAITWRVEHLPTSRIEPMLGLVEAVDGEENAGKVVSVDREHEPWTRQASPEPGTEAGGTVGCRDRWSEAVVAEENGGSRLIGRSPRHVPSRSENPGDHEVLKVRNGLALKARRLDASDVCLGGDGACMIEDCLRRQHIAAGSA